MCVKISKIRNIVCHNCRNLQERPGAGDTDTSQHRPSVGDASQDRQSLGDASQRSSQNGQSLSAKWIKLQKFEGGIVLKLGKSEGDIHPS